MRSGGFFRRCSRRGSMLTDGKLAWISWRIPLSSALCCSQTENQRKTLGRFFDKALLPSEPSQLTSSRQWSHASVLYADHAFACPSSDIIKRFIRNLREQKTKQKNVMPGGESDLSIYFCLYIGTWCTGSDSCRWKEEGKWMSKYNIRQFSCDEQLLSDTFNEREKFPRDQ